MASVEVDLIIEAISKNFDKLSKDLKSVGDAGEKSEKGIEKAGKKTSFLQTQMGKLVTGGVLLAAGKQLLDFGKASITAASDVEEMQSKFDTVFKSLAGPVTQELEAFAEAANRSKFDLMGFAATLQDTFVPLGFARDQAADMSVELVKLAEDLASFNNMDTETVVRDLQSALVGNTETLRKYGVVAQVAQIKQEALSSGLWDGKGAIDAQAKAQAILQLTLKGTTDAQGDAIKTADSYANTSKGLEAAMTDLKVAIGEGLLPVMGDLKQEATGLISALANDMQTQKQLTQAYQSGIITYKEWLALSRESRKQGGLNAETNEEYAETVNELNSLLAKQAGEMGKVNQAAVEAAAADAVLLSHTNDLIEAEAARIQGIIEYSAEAAEAAGVSEDLADKTAQLANQTGTEEQAVMAANLAHEQAVAAKEADREATEALKQATADYFTEAINTKDGIGLYNESADEMADRTIFVSNLTNEQRGALSDLQAEYEKAQGIITDYTIGTKGVGLETEAVNEKVAEQQARMVELQAAMEPLIGVGGEYANVTGTMTINEEALNQSILDSVIAADASAEQIAILGGALGLYSDEAVEAALKTAAIQVKIDELAASYVAGDISVEQMRTGIQDFITTLNEVPDSVSTDVQVTGIDSAMAKVGSLQQQLNQLGGQVSAADAAGATQRDSGAVNLAHGADFVVPPGFPNDSFGPLFVQSGEHVTVTPPGQGGGGGSGVTNVFNVSQRPGENGNTFAKRVARMAADEIGSLK